MDFLAPMLASPALGTALTIGGSLFQGVSSMQSGKAQSKQAKQNAALASQQAAIDADKMRKQTGLRVSANKAAYGAAGIMTNSGSALLVDITQTEEGEIDAQNILRQGIINSNAYSMEANSSSSQGTTGLIGGIVNAGGSYLNYKSKSDSGVLTGKSLFGPK